MSVWGSGLGLALEGGPRPCPVPFQAQIPMRRLRVPFAPGLLLLYPIPWCGVTSVFTFV